MKIILALVTIFLGTKSFAQTRVPHSPSECWTKTFSYPETPYGSGDRGMLTLVIDPEKIQNNTEMLDLIKELHHLGFEFQGSFGIVVRHVTPDGGIFYGDASRRPEAKHQYELHIRMTEWSSRMTDQQIDENFQKIFENHPAVDPIVDCMHSCGPGIRVGG